MPDNWQLQPHKLNYIVKLIAYRTDDGWKPAVQQGWEHDSTSFTTTIYDLTLETEAAAMAHARAIATDEAEMFKCSMDAELKRIKGEQCSRRHRSN